MGNRLRIFGIETKEQFVLIGEASYVRRMIEENSFEIVRVLHTSISEDDLIMLQNTPQEHLAYQAYMFMKKNAFTTNPN